MFVLMHAAKPCYLGAIKRNETDVGLLTELESYCMHATFSLANVFSCV